MRPPWRNKSRETLYVCGATITFWWLNIIQFCNYGVARFICDSKAFFARLLKLWDAKTTARARCTMQCRPNTSQLVLTTTATADRCSWRLIFGRCCHHCTAALLVLGIRVSVSHRLRLLRTLILFCWNCEFVDLLTVDGSAWVNWTVFLMWATTQVDTRTVYVDLDSRRNMEETMHKVTIYHPPGRPWNVADDSGFNSHFTCKNYIRFL